MISRLIAATTIAAALTGTAAFAQTDSYSTPGWTPPSRMGNTHLGPSPMNEATGYTTPSGATVPRYAPIPAQNIPPAVSENEPAVPSGETGAIRSAQNDTNEVPAVPPVGEGETASIGSGSLEPVASMPNSAQALMGATVKSASGTNIGTVEHITTDSHGSPQKVTVAVNSKNITGPRTLDLATQDMGYASGSHVAVSGLTDNELDSLAMAHTRGDHRYGYEHSGYHPKRHYH